MLTVLLALVASLLFAFGNVLQQRIAMGYSDREADSPWFLLKLIRSPVWVAGMAIILVGFCFHAGALSGATFPRRWPTQSIATPVGVILGVALFEEAIHDSTLGRIASLFALAVMMIGIAGLAARPPSAVEPVVNPDPGGER